MKKFLSDSQQFHVLRKTAECREYTSDLLAIEEPLEIRIAYGPEGQRIRSVLTVTMRTPGHDFDLALGFLFTEGLIGKKEDIVQMRYAGSEEGRILLVELASTLSIDSGRFSRHSFTASSCGICGKTALDAVHSHSVFLLRPGYPLMREGILTQLAGALRSSQPLFVKTGGSHAAALFDTGGKLLCVREDIGRHNALDKVIGAMMQSTSPPFSDAMLFVSGRAGFEIVQKALMAGIPILSAVGAPSSLAAELAISAGMTLAGFVRGEEYNIYSGGDRISQE